MVNGSRVHSDMKQAISVVMAWGGGWLMGESVRQAHGDHPFFGLGVMILGSAMFLYALWPKEE